MAHKREFQSDQPTESRKKVKNGNHEWNTASRTSIPSYASKNSSTDESRKSNWPPPLPSIDNEAMRKAVFTHQGNLPIEHSRHSIMSYERLEFLGDAYVEIFASKLLFHKYPELSPGKLSSIRETLVRNETLSAYSEAYGFDKKIKIPKGRDSVKDKQYQKILADIFEAYVAGIILSRPDNGEEQAESWLHRLWTRKLESNDNQPRDDKTSKEALMKKIGGKDVRIEYIDEAGPEHLKDGLMNYKIGAYLTGWGWKKHRIGFGQGGSKREAGSAAAADALSNNPLIPELVKAKRAFDAKTRAQRQKEAQSQTQ